MPGLTLGQYISGLARLGTGHWLKVLVVGVTSNRSAIGARVTAHYGGRTQTQDVSAQSSFYSATTGACTSVWARPGLPI